MSFRPAAVVLALLVALGGLSACTPEPEPTESAPAFASEEEAFAAAEETYRGYIGAANAVDLSDPATFEDMFAWTEGEFNGEVRQAFSQMHAEGLTVSGPTVIALAQPRASRPGDGFETVLIDVCLDVSEVTLTNPDGTSAVSPDRRDVQAMLVTVSSSHATPSGYAITDITGREGAPECG